MYSLKQRSFIDGFINGIGLLDLKLPKYTMNIHDLGDFIKEIEKQKKYNEEIVYKQLKLDNEIKQLENEIKRLKEKLEFEKEHEIN